MSTILIRLIWAAAALVAAPVVFCALFIVLEVAGWSDLAGLTGAVTGAALFFILAWIAVWRTEITWTLARRMKTLFAALGSVAIATGCGALVAHAFPYGDEEVAVVAASLVWLPLWIASTALAWRENRGERESRLAALAAGHVCCPNCGYDLTGLHESRCPECGTQYTLNQLFSAMHNATHHLPTDAGRVTPSAEPWWRERPQPPDGYQPWCMAGVTVLLLGMVSSPAHHLSVPGYLIVVLLALSATALAATYLTHLIGTVRVRKAAGEARLRLRPFAWRWLCTPACALMLVSLLVTPWPACVRFAASKSAFDQALAETKSRKSGKVATRRVGGYQISAIRVRNDGSILFESSGKGLWSCQERRHGIIFAPEGNTAYGAYLGNAEGGSWRTACVHY